MSVCSPGDRVAVKIKNGLIVNQYEDQFEQIVTLDIICLCDGGYLVYIPSDLPLKNSFYITKENYQEYNAPKQFIFALAHYITDNHVIELRQKLDGAKCSKCLEWVPMAEPGRWGDGFICYLCRNYPWRGGGFRQ